MAKELKTIPTFKVPREVHARCINCGKEPWFEVSNIKKDEIEKILNCPSCGGHLEIIKVNKIKNK